MALDELGNESTLDYILKGGGKLYGKLDGESSFTYLGESHEVLQNFEIEKDTIPNTEGCTTGVAASYIKSTTLTLNWDSYSYTPENIGRAFLGTVAEGAAPLTDEAIITEAVKPGEYIDIGHFNITACEVQDDTDTTTYLPDVDYVIDMKSGMLGIIIGGGIADLDVLHLTVTTDQGKDQVQYLHGETKDMAIRFIGCASTGKSR